MKISSNQLLKRAKREVEYDKAQNEIEKVMRTSDDSYLEKRIEEEFWTSLWDEINSWETDLMNENEKKVYNAVKIILNSKEDIEIFNKKAVYLYLREITGLNTKQIVSQLNKMRKKYRSFKHRWDNDKFD